MRDLFRTVGAVDDDVNDGWTTPQPGRPVVDAAHLVMLSRPAELTAALLDLAG